MRKPLGWRPIDTKVLVCMQRSWTDDRIAKHLEVTKRTVQNIVANETFQERLKNVTEKVMAKTVDKLAEQATVDKTREYLQSKMLLAAKKVWKLAKTGGDKIERLQFEAAKEILHLGGLTPKLQVEDTTPLSREYTTEEVAQALAVLNEVEITMERLKDKDSQFYLAPKETDKHEPSISPGSV